MPHTALPTLSDVRVSRACLIGAFAAPSDKRKNRARELLRLSYHLLTLAHRAITQHLLLVPLVPLLLLVRAASA